MSNHTNFQDFHTVNIGSKTRPKTAVSRSRDSRTHEQTVTCRLQNSDMGDESFDLQHLKTETKNAQFRTKFTNARNALKLNQQSFATYLNIRKSVVQDIESGKRKPDPALMQQINMKIHNLM
jgi:DNA-binding transcriptional regulator YiaG